MTINFRPPKRQNMPLLFGLTGPSGGGKSLSALKLARGLAGDQPFAYLDTENGRAQMYDEYCEPWVWGDFREPFSPERYGEEIKAADAAGYPVIVIDSFTHEWSGPGGVQDMHAAEQERLSKGNPSRYEAVSWPAWNKPRTAHRALVNDVLLRLTAHVIVCLRAEKRTEMVNVTENGREKQKIIPKRSRTGVDVDGWEAVCEKSLPFELTFQLLLLPSAPGVPIPMKKLPPNAAKLIPLDKPLSEETGAALAKWAAGGAATGASKRKSESEAATLTTELLELGEQMGKKDDVAAAIARHRSGHAAQPAQHVTWLKSQIKRAREATEALAAVGAEESGE